MSLVLLSWNVHAWVGPDGRRDPARCFESLREIGADAVALQEVEGTDWQRHAESAGFECVTGPTRDLLFGNALLHRASLRGLQRVDLSVPGREPRGALDAILELPTGPLRVVVTHLGLRASERRRQAARLARHLEEDDEGWPLALLGDLNDWTPWGGQLAAIARAVGPLSRVRTFPSWRPVFPLDRAACRTPGWEPRVSALRSDAVRRASDHLVLRLELAAAGEPG